MNGAFVLNDQSTTIFRERALPVPARLAGYAALIDRYGLSVPLHHEMAAVAIKHTRRKEDGWAIYPATSFPGNGDVDHLKFALRYEGIQLLTLKTIFTAFDKAALEQAAREQPTSGYMRRLCFLYEWLMDDRLDVPDTAAGAYVSVLDPTQQYGTPVPTDERRFRLRNNLPGSRQFCPTVHRTKRIDAFLERDLSGAARKVVDSAPKELISRAAAFLLLSDSKASFEIEGERPSKDRLARWGQLLGRAGQIALDLEDLENLQREVIGDARLVTLGLRREGGFIGRHTAMGQPDPDHISARSDDLRSLMAGLTQFEHRSVTLDYDPVLAAAAIAFGFVYIHPFEDGNGRLHRFLLHHVLSQRRFTPPGIVLPISSVMLDDIARYKDVLETTSRPLLDHIVWKTTSKGNVEVTSGTADFYRYFDATAHAEYLFDCVARVVDKDLPEELAFLEHRDAFHRRATQVIDMGERTIDLLLRFLQQSHGSLSKRALANEFSALTPAEVGAIETIYAELPT